MDKITRFDMEYVYEDYSMEPKEKGEYILVEDLVKSLQTRRRFVEKPGRYGTYKHEAGNIIFYEDILELLNEE